MDDSTTQTAPLRRFVQFRLRTLLIATFLACLGLALLQWRAERQRRALAELKSLGVRVAVAEEPRFPHWVRTLAGDDWLGAEYAVELEGGINDEQFRAVKAIPRVASISVVYAHSERFQNVQDDLKRLQCDLPGVKTFTIKGDR